MLRFMKKLLTQDEAVALLEAEQEKEDLSLTELAAKYGVSRQYMFGVLNKKQKPTETIGFEQVLLYRRKNGTKR